MKFLKRFSITITFALLAFIVVRDASAHALLITSDPAPNAILEKSPLVVEMWVTEPVEAGFTRIKVLDSNGIQVQDGDTRIDPADPTHITVALTSLPEGIYTVSWKALSILDGHITTGTFPFAVGEFDADELAIVSANVSEVETVSIASVLTRWLFILGTTLIAGIVVFKPYVWEPAWAKTQPDADNPADYPYGWFTYLFEAGLVIFVIGNLTRLIEQTITATELPFFTALLNGDVGDLLFETRYGLLWLIQLALIFLLIATFNRNRWLPALATGGIVLAHSFNTHVAAAPDPWLPIAANWIHIIAASVWLGGLGYFFLGLWQARSLPQTKRLLLSAELVPRFSNVGLTTVGALLATGIYTAFLTVGEWDALFETTYGTALLFKLAILLPTIGLAALNLLILRPQLQKDAKALRKNADAFDVETDNIAQHLYQSVFGEVGLAIGLLLAAVYFASTPLAASFGERMQYAQSDEGITIDLNVLPGTVGINLFEVTLTEDDTGAVVDNATDVILRFTPNSGELAPSEVKAEYRGEGVYSIQATNLSLPDDWFTEVVVRRPEAFDSYAEFTLPLQIVEQAPATDNTLIRNVLIGILIATAALAMWASNTYHIGNRKKQAIGSFQAALLGLTAAGLFLGWGSAALDYAELPNPYPMTTEVIELGELKFAQNCSVCHGVTGEGNGPAAINLVPRPANLHEHAIYGVHTDGTLYDWITNGYPENPAMPAWGDTLTDEERWAVVSYLRTLPPENGN